MPTKIIDRRTFLDCVGVSAAAAALGCPMNGQPPPPPPPPGAFDIGAIVGNWTQGDYPVNTNWQRQAFGDSQGVVNADISDTFPRTGAGSLELTLDIRGQTQTNRNGEVFVDLRYMPDHDAKTPVIIQRYPDGKPIGVDLSNKYLYAWVYCPLDTAGSRSAPNGVQIFLKSVSLVNNQEVWKSYYGDWQNIWIGSRDSGAHPDLGNVIAGIWSPIIVHVPYTTQSGLSWTPTFGDVEAGFVPESVALLGIKYGLNHNSNGNVSSRIFVDNFGWSDLNNDEDVVFRFDQINNPITDLRYSGFNAGSILQTEYMDTLTSTSISPADRKSHSDDEIIALIDEMKTNDMTVSLKPHVDVLTDEWRGLIHFNNESDKAAWFNAYTTFITHYAALAEANGVEMLVMGTEFKSLEGNENKQYWGQVVDAIRNVFFGTLTYAANWDSYQQACLWDFDGIDAVGIDAYFPLSSNRDPSLQELVNGWSPHVAALESWQANIGKPIIFTELGYRSVDYAAREPWEYQEDRHVNLELQKRCYQAVYDVFGGKPWFDGFYVWNVSPRKDDGGSFNKDFTPYHKPAQGAFLA
ncbi:MAG: glycoside hydrolase TIM-barrel-like domain-containing protein [Candidatus Woesearchaeota archaeon]